MKTIQFLVQKLRKEYRLVGTVKNSGDAQLKATIAETRNGSPKVKYRTAEFI